jgi:hypothetical protein
LEGVKEKEKEKIGLRNIEKSVVCSYLRSSDEEREVFEYFWRFFCFTSVTIDVVLLLPPRQKSHTFASLKIRLLCLTFSPFALKGWKRERKAERERAEWGGRRERIKARKRARNT